MNKKYFPSSTVLASLILCTIWAVSLLILGVPLAQGLPAMAVTLAVGMFLISFMFLLDKAMKRYEKWRKS